MSDTRPELGKMNVGDPVIIIQHPTNNRHHPEPIEATVTKVGTRLVTITQTNPANVKNPREWKMRMSTQQVDPQYSHVYRFVTPEQHAWDLREAEADRYLFEAGLQINTAKIPYIDRRALTFKVANLLRVADGLDPL